MNKKGNTHTANSSKELIYALIKNEYKTIVGKKQRGLLFLMIILLITFISLGHVLSGLNQLEESMNNPFTNWVNLDNIGEKNISELNTKILDGNAKKLGIKNIKKYTRTYWEILDSSLSNKLKIPLRDVAMDDPIFNTILEENNLIHLNNNSSYAECGIIIEKEFLELARFANPGISDKVAVIYPHKGNDHIVILDIYAVVKELPNEVGMIIPPKVASLEHNGAEFINLGSSRSIFFLSKNKIDIDTFSKLNLNEIEEIDKISESFEFNGTNYFYYEFFLSKKEPYAQCWEIAQKVSSIFEIIPISPYNCSPIEENYSYSYIAYNFDDLSKIKEFSKFAKSQGVAIPLHQVRSKENFLLVSNIAVMFIILLIFFSAASILLYLKNTLQNHLEKIRPNLGTLKAFGLNNRIITRVYFLIIFKFYFTASILAFSISMAYHFIMYLCNPRNLSFNIFDFKILIAWLFIGLILLLFYKNSVAKILTKPPGDLIYNR